MIFPKKGFKESLFRHFTAYECVFRNCCNNRIATLRQLRIRYEAHIMLVRMHHTMFNMNPIINKIIFLIG